VLTLSMASYCYVCHAKCFTKFKVSYREYGEEVRWFICNEECL